MSTNRQRHIRRKAMTNKEKAFLLVVEANCPAKAGYLGAMAYGGKKPQAYSRPASKILRRLEKQGMVRADTREFGVYWRITRNGLDALRETVMEAEPAKERE
jgi:hypothetical protein